ncbi:hypothetical protein AN933_20430 [Mycobacterium intracellulare subsp. chimaera]|nr:hypothetical protein AN933_20430 [Mycobacterium intracellulare subsp. chimaera]
MACRPQDAAFDIDGDDQICTEKASGPYRQVVSDSPIDEQPIADAHRRKQAWDCTRSAQCTA